MICYVAFKLLSSYVQSKIELHIRYLVVNFVHQAIAIVTNVLDMPTLLAYNLNTTFEVILQFLGIRRKQSLFAS